MASKTIMVDLEAYRRLKSVRSNNESFSQTIKRLIKPPLDLKAFEECICRNTFSRQATAAIEKHIAHRHRPSKRKR